MLFLCGCIYEMMTWLLEVYVIFPLWCFYCWNFMHDVWRFMEDVTSISWIFIIFAYFIALIEVGRYTQSQDTNMYLPKPVGLVKALKQF